jgi:hypothetical protein
MKSRAETYGIVNDFLHHPLLPPQISVIFSRFRNKFYPAAAYLISRNPALQPFVYAPICSTLSAQGVFWHNEGCAEKIMEGENVGHRYRSCKAGNRSESADHAGTV